MSEVADEELVACASAPDLATAELWAACLRDHGLRVVVPDATTASMMWTWQQAIGLRLLVPRSELEEATALLASLEAEDPGDGKATSAPSGDDDSRLPGDDAAHRAYKAAVVATLFVVLVPYAGWLLIAALRQRRATSRWGRRRLSWAVAIQGIWLAVFAAVAVVALRPEPSAEPQAEPRAESVFQLRHPSATPDPVSPELDALFVTARLRFQTACEEGEAGACHQLGTMWRDGWGGPASDEEAGRWLRRGCELGHADSCAALKP